ncbi:MAG: VF530 family protein [bacterium]
MNPISTQKDPLHGKTLLMILEYLVEHFGFEELGRKIKIKCFTTNPSIKSSLVFLRKTPWARAKVEDLYLIAINNKKGECLPELLQL